MTVRQTADLTTIRLQGDMDPQASHQARQLVHDAVDGLVSDVLVDLRGVTDMDAEALAILLAAHERLTAQNRRLALVSLNPRIEKLLGRIGVGDVLTLHPSPQAALDSLRAARRRPMAA